MTDPTPLISVVLPAHNEEGNVVPMAQQLTALLQPLGDFEIIFVDDHSTDQTLTRLRALADGDRRVRYISFVRNFGHQIALRAGLRHARGRAVILMDCDFEHPLELIPQLIAHWREGTMIVATRRTGDQAQPTFLKRATSRLFYRLFDAISDVSIEPGSADFLLLDRLVVDSVNAFENRDVFLRGLVRWLGFPTVTVDYAQGRRTAGEPSFTLRRMVDLAVTGIVAHSIRPLRIAIYLALIFAIFAGLLFIYSVVSFLWIGHTVAGWTSIMSAIATLGAGQFLVLGILGEYFGRMFMESRRWPLYLIGETETSYQSAEFRSGAWRPATRLQLARLMNKPMSNPASNWIGFWNSEHSIYVNARHLDLHYSDIADHIVALGFEPTARILDYGCGEAVHADRVAARAGELWLCEASSRVRDNLRARFRSVSNIRVVAPDEIEALPDGAFDLIVANSVVQYWTPQELNTTLRTWRRLMAPSARLVLADVIPPGCSPILDALALLRYAVQRGFLFAAIVGLFRTAFSPYRRIRSELGITTYEEAEIIDHIRGAGLAPRRLPYNFEHQPKRMTFVATAVEVPS